MVRSLQFVACPVAALQEWLEPQHHRGPIFRSIGRRATCSPDALQTAPPQKSSRHMMPGAPAWIPRFYSSHSLRSGFVTSAATGGAAVEAEGH